MFTAIEIVFWLAAAKIFYIYLGYPLLIGLWAHLKKQEPLVDGPVPTCSILIVGYNEATNLPAKLHSILSGTVTPLEIVVGSDGSNDDTPGVLTGVETVIHHAFADRRGKPAVLNELIPLCLGEVVVLTDARQELAADALERLLSRFADPKVCAVSV